MRRMQRSQVSVTCGLVSIVFLAAHTTRGQVLEQLPRFEVASIKPSEPSSRMVVLLELKHGRLTGKNITLKKLLMAAFGVTGQQVVGPQWLDAERFDVIAKAPETVPDRESKRLLQALLIDRFGLKSHTETRVMPVYELIIAKGGPKMLVYPAPPERSADTRSPQVRGYPMMRMAATTGRFAEVLSSLVDRTVVDRTGLTERYDILFTFSPLTAEGQAEKQDGVPPDLFTAIQEQLGLKLKADKIGMDVVVVDQMQRRSSEN